MLIPEIKLFDSHLHIIDPAFPLVSNQGFLPEPFTSQDYLQQMRHYHLAGGAVVSGSFQAFDQSYLLSALKQLGPSFVGVTQLPVAVSDEHLQKLNKAGVKGVRFNLKRGGSEQVQHLDAMSRRVYETVGWHTELYIDSSELGTLVPILQHLPALSIDHLGLSGKGQKTLLKLAEKGVRVKACGFGRVDFDVSEALKNFYSANPQALMFGTDLPGTRAPRLYNDSDFFTVLDTLGEENAKKILYDNAALFYRIPVQK